MPDDAAASSSNNAEPRRQDVICDSEEGSEVHVGNILLRDLLQLHVRLREGKKGPSSKELDDVTKHIVHTVQNGSDYILPADVESPEPFVDGTSRFVTKQEDGTFSQVEEKEAIAFVANRFEDLLKKQEDASEKKEPGTGEGDKAAASMPGTSDGDKAAASTPEASKQKAGSKTKSDSGADKEHFAPAMDDVVLLKRGEPIAHAPINRTGTSHLVAEIGRYLSKKKLWIKSSLEDRRAEAALLITDKLSTANVRVLAQSGDAEKLMYLKEIERVDTAEFILILLFDSIIRAEDELAKGHPMLAVDLTNYPAEEFAKPSTVPIEEPSIHDVLFGRGGGTNTHAGNKRFRDVVSLHRADYVRAIKIEKPNVARRIVRAIRCGNPPGRFLKKDKDGLWYDVGDKHAAEKTSQALREKSEEKGETNGGDDKKRAASAVLAGSPATRLRLAPEPSAGLQLTPTSTLSPLQVKLPPISAYSDGPSLVSTGAKGRKKRTKKAPDSKSPPEDDVAFVAKASAAGSAERFDKDGNIMVTIHDVLCGRGGLSNHHEGNRRFRDIIALHRADYTRAPKIQKPAVARLIVKAMRNSSPAVRFIKKDEKTGKWSDIGDKRAAEKTSQALREKSQEERDKEKVEQAGTIPISLHTNPELYRATSEALKAIVPNSASPPEKPEGASPKNSKKGEKSLQTPPKETVSV